MHVGTISEITRHPVKSMRGQKVNETKVMNYGLYGDRSHALLDENESFLTITQFPDMVTYRASFEEPDSLESFPEPKVTTMSGHTYKWSDEEWLEEIERRSSKKLTRISYHPEHVPFGAIEEANLLLVTDASLQALSESYGSSVDDRRFRPNLQVSLTNQEAFVEQDWVGKTLQIGDNVKVDVTGPCERCMIITVDPESGSRQPDLLKKVVKDHRNQFGIYLRVIETGLIKVGDEVHVIDRR
ncbi:MOSC domain-containing protein [Guptibacillus algicola]|uniref:MOSC domain-containing protein n=1 Tax=Guptibacillus algicola TaxID=225844 RepID=UPI001CD243BE|nr:MOSC domain-containing protein [Alkalihalobacillus algicola]MCA0988727.1 MOSC domain-containing protein [Alkalihalobacillus algicola]